MFFKILLAFFVHIVVGIVVLVRGCIYLCERKEENCVGAFLVFFPGLPFFYFAGEIFLIKKSFI